MKEITIWHNPRCSKSRQTLELLQAKGHDPRVVRYLDDSPSVSEIRKLLKMLGCQPRELMRTKEALYKELDLAQVEDDKALIQAMVEHPKLIERPIVTCGQRAAIGRPPESVLSVLE
ncbi:Arsenate reductase [Planctomycetes bacterium CA13]|uniref:Arsenate reductase n=1 Tax=Novipirellula herctigrandis TaxID=2527986 RepID=A0A5C5ZE51_9BACT|nr:Arsenate reductase [Planctomycetes bacterium CA13]